MQWIYDSPQLAFAIFVCALNFESVSAREAASSGAPVGMNAALGPVLSNSDRTGDSLQTTEILGGSDDWSVVSEGHSSVVGLTADAHGMLFFNDPIRSKTYTYFPQIFWTQPESFLEESGGARGQAFGPDGRLYAAANGEKKIVAYTGDHAMEILAEGISANDLAIGADGAVYVSEWDSAEPSTGRIWIIPRGQPARVALAGLRTPISLAISAKTSRLFVAESDSESVDTYPIEAGGALGSKRRFCAVVASPKVPESRLKIRVSREGLVLAGNARGIGVYDSLGNQKCMIPVPPGDLADFAFAGPKFDQLYLASGGKLYRRTLGIHGIPPLQSPAKIPPRNP